MADFNMQAIECPICKTEQTTKIWECVDVTANEKRKEKLLADEIFVFKCAKCGHTVPLVYNCLYVDDDARLMIWMLPEACSATGAISLKWNTQRQKPQI